MKTLKTQKGITLVALVITIIVLLILAIVAIGSVQDSGIIGHAQNSADRYNTGKTKEESMIGQYEDLISEYENGGSFGTSGDGSGNLDTDEEEGEIASNAPEELKKYILGRKFLDDLFRYGEFDADEELGIEKGEITYVTSIARNANEIITYIKYKEKIYKFKSDGKTEITDAKYGVVELEELEEKVRLGKTVKYDNKIWTIIYDDSTNGLQMISNQGLLYNGTEFHLGYNDSLVTNWNSLETKTDEFKSADVNGNEKLDDEIEKSIYSYNMAIETLNIACKNIVTPNANIIDVRSVGSNPTNKNDENKVLYTSETLKNQPKSHATYKAGAFDKRGKREDFNYISDLERMIILGFDFKDVSRSNEYWVASRLISVYQDYEEIYFEIRKSGFMERTISLFGGDYILDPIHFVEGSDSSAYLRPVIMLNQNTNLVEDVSGEADYIIK